jgi:hypothetical protein
MGPAAGKRNEKGHRFVPRCPSLSREILPFPAGFRPAGSRIFAPVTSWEPRPASPLPSVSPLPSASFLRRAPSPRFPPEPRPPGEAGEEEVVPPSLRTRRDRSMWQATGSETGTNTYASRYTPFLSGFLRLPDNWNAVTSAPKYSTESSRCNCFFPGGPTCPRRECRTSVRTPLRKSRRPRTAPSSASPGCAPGCPLSATADPPGP